MTKEEFVCWAAIAVSAEGHICGAWKHAEELWDARPEWMKKDFEQKACADRWEEQLKKDPFSEGYT